MSFEAVWSASSTAPGLVDAGSGVVAKVNGAAGRGELVCAAGCAGAVETVFTDDADAVGSFTWIFASVTFWMGAGAACSGVAAKFGRESRREELVCTVGCVGALETIFAQDSGTVSSSGSVVTPVSFKLVEEADCFESAAKDN